MASKAKGDVVSLTHEKTGQEITVQADAADTYRSQGWRDSAASK